MNILSHKISPKIRILERNSSGTKCITSSGTKIKKNKKNHRLTRGTLLTALVISVWKGPNWSTFSKGGMQLTLF